MMSSRIRSGFTAATFSNASNPPEAVTILYFARLSTAFSSMMFVAMSSTARMV